MSFEKVTAILFVVFIGLGVKFPKAFASSDQHTLSVDDKGLAWIEFKDTKLGYLVSVLNKQCGTRIKLRDSTVSDRRIFVRYHCGLEDIKYAQYISKALGLTFTFSPTGEIILYDPEAMEKMRPDSQGSSEKHGGMSMADRAEWLPEKPAAFPVPGAVARVVRLGQDTEWNTTGSARCPMLKTLLRTRKS